MRSFVSDPQMDVSHLQRESTPTYLLARDEDCENSFHSSADFVRTVDSAMASHTVSVSHRWLRWMIYADEYVLGPQSAGQ